MFFRVDPDDHEPIYAQIEGGIKLGIIRRVWRVGEQIPSRRDLAEELRVNPNTIAVAYRNLAREGVVEVRRGLGVFVSKGAPEACRRSQARVLADRLARLISEAREAGLDDTEVRRLFDDLLASTPSPDPNHETGDQA